jgi:hypothetical protein
VDAFWQAGIDAGHRDDGAPGPRTIYGPDYYGGFLFDPDGNSVDAVHGNRERPVPDGRIDHLWLRVRDPQASRRFYTTVAPQAGLRVANDAPDRVQLSGPGERAVYHPGYYAAFVLDPDGHNVEVVNHNR